MRGCSSTLLGKNARDVLGVSAFLRCEGPNGVRHFAPGSFILASKIETAPPPNTPPNLSDGSVNITVPDGCTVPHSNPLLTEAEIGLPGGAKDPNLSNNILGHTFTFAAPPRSQPFRIGWVTLQYKPPGQANATASTTDVNAAADMLRAVYPLPEGSVVSTPLAIDFPVVTKQTKTTPEWQVLINQFAKALLTADLPPNNPFDQIIGLLPKIAGAELAGLADAKWVGGGGTAVLMQDYGALGLATTLPHEIGHNLGLRHTNVAAPTRGCPELAEDADTAWPFPNPTIQTYGFTFDYLSSVPPERFDHMSYCPDADLWTSPCSFEALFRTNLQPMSGLPLAVEFNDLPKKHPEQRLAEPVEQWLISGLVRADATAATLEPFLRVTSSRTPETSNPSGSHCIRFSAADGSTVSSYCFSCDSRARRALRWRSKASSS